MKTILVPIDGSACSDRAVETAGKIAQAFAGDIVLLNVVQPNFLLTTPGVAGVESEEAARIYQEADRASEMLLDENRKKLEGIAASVTTVKLHGDARGSLIDYINGHAIDLVVMGSHGLGAAVSRILTGSVATKVLHHVDKPVLIVR